MLLTCSDAALEQSLKVPQLCRVCLPEVTGLQSSHSLRETTLLCPDAALLGEKAAAPTLDNIAVRETKPWLSPYMDPHSLQSQNSQMRCCVCCSCV